MDPIEAERPSYQSGKYPFLISFLSAHAKNKSKKPFRALNQPNGESSTRNPSRKFMLFVGHVRR